MKWIARIFPQLCPTAYVGQSAKIVWNIADARRFNTEQEALYAAQLHALIHEKYDTISIDDDANEAVGDILSV